MATQESLEQHAGGVPGSQVGRSKHIRAHLATTGLCERLGGMFAFYDGLVRLRSSAG